ncbi:hypothetical protein T440DRAFT_461720 [Plenodomus tracheiphilus IPT5]|uniref:Large ribosomal subunit protein mL67 n=1 Tax=Plenodomus tracheiphilus IPT5 TaxID=1408161 RepID=A0A6A7AR82_9PLEO|nr:hypothetical protein T440DRAFT_461720 [Plenodomus tracheiphilus IPT5]
MPRSLARLRYRTPLKALKFPTIARRPELDATVAKYVERQSQPQLLRLQTVVNAKAKRQATGVDVPEPWRPYTLRDVVDPKKLAKHGQIIYVFRNTKTNQIIYSLQELLDDHHLDQIPFIGKHSKPPTLRPDEWQPHCVVTFPTSYQGLSAYRRLREFRKLHELAWEKTNPEYKRLDIKTRITKIMDQRANFSADLAEVLRMQEDYGNKMKQEREELDQKAEAYLEKRWKEIDDIAKAAKEKEKVTDSIKWLEGQVRSMNLKLRMKHNQKEDVQKSLKATKESLETRLRKVKYAVRKTQELKDTRTNLTTLAVPANEAGAEEKLERLRSEAEILENTIKKPDPRRNSEDQVTDRERLATLKAEIATLKQAFKAKKYLASHGDTARLSILPKYFTSKTSTPIFTLSNVDVAWADMQDALYARGQWPDTIAHQVLEVNGTRGQVSLLNAEEYGIEVKNEANSIIAALEEEKRLADEQGKAIRIERRRETATA